MKDYICFDIYDLRHAPRITKRTISAPDTLTACEVARAFVGKSLYYTEPYPQGRRALVNVFGTEVVAFVVAPVPRVIGEEAEKQYNQARDEWGELFDVVAPEMWRGVKCYY